MGNIADLCPPIMTIENMHTSTALRKFEEFIVDIVFLFLNAPVASTVSGNQVVKL